jgi:hypothetical protein
VVGVGGKFCGSAACHYILGRFQDPDRDEDTHAKNGRSKNTDTNSDARDLSNRQTTLSKEVGLAKGLVLDALIKQAQRQRTVVAEDRTQLIGVRAVAEEGAAEVVRARAAVIAVLVLPCAAHTWDTSFIGAINTVIALEGDVLGGVHTTG